MLKEKDASEETLAEAGTFRQLSDRPVFVLTAMVRFTDQTQTEWKLTTDQVKKSKETWIRMQDDIATWSSQSQHQLVPDANHYIQFDRPDIVISAVRSVVEKVREKSGLKSH